jgi:DNA end-binding protein Ku
VVKVEELLFRGHPEVVDADLADYFGSIPHAELLQSVARRIVDRRVLHIVNQKSGRFEPDKFEDHYETALVDLINSKRSGKPITPKERPAGGNVVDLMEALRRSVSGAAPAKASKPAKKPRKAASGQKEMLMLIEGKKASKESTAKKSASKSQRKSA